MAEIAAVLGRSHVAVRVLLFRAREMLGRHLDPLGERADESRVRAGAGEAERPSSSRPPSAPRPSTQRAMRERLT